MLVLWILATASAHSQTSGPEPHGATMLQGSTPLARLVDLAANRLELEITYSPADLTTEVTIRDAGGLDDDALWTLVNDLLWSRGFTTIRSTRRPGVRVVRAELAIAQARLEFQEAGALRAGFERRLVPFPQSESSELVETIRTLLSRHGSATNAGNGLLIVADQTERIDQALRVVARIERAGTRVTRERIRLRHLPSQRLIALVTQVNAKQSLVTGRALAGELVALPDDRELLLITPEAQVDQWRELIQSLDQREPSETRRYDPAYFALEDVSSLIEESVGGAKTDDRWNVVVDRLSGSLRITATPSDHAKITELLDGLTKKSPATRWPARSFVIRNRDVSEVQEVLASLIDAGVLNAAARRQADVAGAGSQTSRRGPGAQALTKPSRETNVAAPQIDSRPLPNTQDAPPITLTADEGTNTLIAIGEPRAIEQIQDLLKIIDVRQPQVLLEVMLVSLSEGETQDLGVELAAIVKDSGTLIRLSSLFGLSSIVPELLSTAGAGAQGGTAVVLDPGDFSAVIRALQTINSGRSVSMPKVLVNNNQDATFDSVLQQPFISINAADTIATTSFGGSEDAGTTISVRPQIAAGDHLILEYSISLSSFVGEATDPALPPPRQQNSLTSSATIPDGFTIAVGGIELESVAQAVSKTPLLADIPLLGELFKNRSDSGSRSRFYAFIRATVLRHESFEDLKYISANDANAAEIDDGWPIVAPRVIR